MRAAVVHELGKTPRCDQFPEPVPGDDEVLVHVRAASLKPVDKQMASGSHYATPRELPFVCGTDGVGHLGDGQRVFFGGCRPPYGAIAERAVVPKAFVFPVPDALTDELGAALPNPGCSAWLALRFRAKLAAGEHVLVLGATGVTGRLAVQLAKRLGAGRVVAAGRNLAVLESLRGLGADGIIPLDSPAQELHESFLREAGASGFQVVIDYVWGPPTEAFLAAATRTRFARIGNETRLVQAGESAGPTIALPAAVLRSTALTILGTAGVPSSDLLSEALRRVMALGAAGELRVDTIAIPLADVDEAWERDRPGRRIVITP